MIFSASPGVSIRPIPEIDPLPAWCQQELALLRRQKELLQGKIGTYECGDSGRLTRLTKR